MSRRVTGLAGAIAAVAAACEPIPPRRAAPAQPPPSAAATAPATGGAASSHCTDRETLVFGCRLGDELASLCGAKDVSGAWAYLQFRYGPPGAPRVTVPRARAGSPAAFRMARYAAQGAGYLALEFQADGQRYRLRDEVPGGGARRAELAIETPDGAAIETPCEGAVTGALADIADAVPPADAP